MQKHSFTETLNSGSKLDVHRYLSLFLSSITVCCAIVLVCALCAVAVSYALPKRYEARSTVSIEQNVVSDLVKGIAITPSMEAKLGLLNVYLLSRNILLKVISTLDMDLDSSDPVRKEQLLERVKRQLTIDQDQRRGVFYIFFTDSNPVLARDFVNTMTRVYIEESTAEKRQESYDATTFLGEQIQVFQRRIEQAQNDVDAFKAEKGMHLGVNEQLLRGQIKDLEEHLENIRIQKSELTAKRNLLRDQGEFRSQLREKELALQSLLATYTERHPAVVRLREDVKSLKAVIDAGQANEENLKHSSEYQRVLVDLQSLGEREKNLNSNLEKNIRDLQELPTIRTQLSELEQRRVNEMHIYEQLVARFGQSEVSKQMELQDKAVSFRVIEAAVTPINHKSPRRHFIMLGGIAVGFLLAGAWLVLGDLLRGKIRSANDLKPFGVRVLSRLPQLSPMDRSRQKRSRVLVASLSLCVLAGVVVLAAMEFFQLPYMEEAIALVRRTLIS